MFSPNLATWPHPIRVPHRGQLAWVGRLPAVALTLLVVARA